MPRVKYKALYLHQLQAAGENLDRAKRAERDLDRIRQALAPFGQTVLASYEAPTKENQLEGIGIGLVPHEYVAVEAFFWAHETRAHLDVNGGWTQLLWRGRKVVQL